MEYKMNTSRSIPKQKARVANNNQPENRELSSVKTPPNSSPRHDSNKMGSGDTLEKNREMTHFMSSKMINSTIKKQSALDVLSETIQNNKNATSIPIAEQAGPSTVQEGLSTASGSSSQETENQNLNTERPLTLERIAAESREPKTEDSIVLSQENSNTAIWDTQALVFKFLLPYLSIQDKKNLRLVRKDIDCLVRENVTFIELKKLNIDEVLKVFPCIEKIKIEENISKENIDKLLKMEHLKDIDIDLSISPNINFWEIDSRLRQKVTHLKCIGEQIRNTDLSEPSSPLPQLTNLDILNPLDENFNSFICNPKILPTLKCLKMEQKLNESILQHLDSSDTLTGLPLIGFKNRELPQLPQSLTSLTLENLLSLEELPQQLPPNLASLTLENLLSLEELPQLPQSLTSLTLENLPKLYTLRQQLPPNLASLTLENLPNLYTLRQQLPPNLASLTLYDLPNLYTLPQQLPPNLASLTLSRIKSLESLPQIPPNLASLTLYALPNLYTLPQQLPPNLASLTLENLPNLYTLPQQLPPNLAFLILENLPNLYTLPQQLPANLAFLTLKNLDNLESVPQQLPANLASLTFSNLPSLEALPQQIPPNLASLTLENLPKLYTLRQQLPPNLAFLTLKNLPNLHILPHQLPQKIINFNIDPELILISSMENRPDTISRNLEK
jgi:hypothetical protein